MQKVFIAGSRRLTRIPSEVRQRLDEMIRRELTVIVGDANGADKAVQAYFAEKGYDKVTVYCTGGGCRNNLRRWPVHAVPAPHAARDFAYFTAKDAAMADDADVALMLWDGQSSGTIVNVARLVSRAKPTVIYSSPSKTFATLKTPEELIDFLAATDPVIRAKLDDYIREHVAKFAQPQIF